jgi:hypothetical protein
MADTPNLQLTFLEANQAQKHITVNEAFRALDVLVQPAVESTGLNTPPGSPVDGARYVVGPAPTGAWAGQAFAIAAWQDGAWAFYPPVEGWSVWDRATDAALTFIGGAWVRQAGLPFPDNLFRLADDADPTRLAAFDLSGISAGTTRTFTLPNLSATLAHLGNAAQTFAGATTFSNAAVTIGTATTTATYGIGTGGTTTGVTKTVNVGTGGAAGSTTVINLGSTTAGALGTTVINTPTVTFAASVTAIGAAAANVTALGLGLGGASPDATNRLSVNAAATLLNNAGGSHEATINKAAAGNDASLALKTGFSARALFGLLGSDDVTLKVSPNGSAFFDALVIDRATGRAEFPEPVILPGHSAVPAVPPAGRLALYGRQRAGAPWLEVVRPTGRDFPLQPHTGLKRIGTWAPSTSTTIVVQGIPLTSAGTISHPALSATSLLTSSRRWRATSAATANSVADQRSALTACWRGNAAGLGGFTLITRISMTTLQPTGIGFFGLLGSVAALATTTVLSALVEAIGLGFERGTHTNWQLVRNDATGAPTLVDLGAGFPVVTAGLLTLTIWCPAAGNSIWLRAVNELTGAVFEQEVTTDLPQAATFLAPRLFLNNGATAAAVAFECTGLYLETDF